MQAKTMMIQRAQPGDLDAIRELLRSFDLPHEDLTPAHLDHFLVARNGDTISGVVGLEPGNDGALLRSLVVAPDARHEGLGTRLVKAIEQRARDDGLRTLYLLTTTAADYFRARGYTQIERDALPEAIQQTDEAARLCPASATCMQKSLSTADSGPQTTR